MASKAVRNLLILQFIGLKYLQSRNIIIIDRNRLSNGLIGRQELSIGKAQEMIDMLIEMGIFGAALAGGFLLAQRFGK